MRNLKLSEGGTVTRALKESLNLLFVYDRDAKQKEKGDKRRHSTLDLCWKLPGRELDHHRDTEIVEGRI